VRAFKDSAPSHAVIGHEALTGQMCSKAHTAPAAPLVLHCTRIDKCAMKKFGINGLLRNKFFFIVIHRFCLVKAAMNAPRIFKLRIGVNKPLNFLIFPLPKAEQRLCALVSCRGV
jgi:hypothetical protein